MHSSKNRWAAAVVGIAASALVLSACSAGTGGESTEGVELTAWGAQTTTDATKAMIEAYEEETGNTINLEIIPDGFDENLLTQWATGARPDILFGQPLQGALLKLNPTKNLQDLSDMAFVESTKFGLEEAGTVDGVHYTATYGFPTLFGLFSNTEVLAANGLEVPTTQAELDTAIATLTAAGVPAFGVTGGDAWTTQLPFFTRVTDAVADGLVEEINTGEAEWTDPRAVEALEWVQGLVTNGSTNPNASTAVFGDDAAMLENGEVAFVAQGTWLTPAFTGGLENIEFTAFPSESGAVMWHSSNLVSIQLPITGDETKEAAAREFVDFATVGDGYQVYLEETGEPSVIEGVDDPADLDPVQQKIVAAFEGSIPSIDTQSAASLGDFPGLMGQLIAGTLTPEQVAEQLQLQFADNAKQAGIEGF
ncbi:ABC transporter substrate-binding protein [Agromyces silvae]|uniref:ABC transporter substrate-binding protein n=1 Tax=Agromyces silvae TaxID=3388266 RepID=UPI00280B8878|nr:extracellular solute-binding protein [Agromyces protaetiae]